MPSIENKVVGVARFNFRLPSAIKDRIEQAAVVSGLTVTDFAISALTDLADEVLEKERSRNLSSRDRDIFLAMLTNETEPNGALQNATAEYKRRVTSK